ncbi:MAG: hypothetical protein IPI67_38105 [Myxococcales bacterium]|nr:hypothetical protein [Myxococcales bacterium]
MRSLLSLARRSALGLVVVPCALFAVACGGSNRDALEKRVATMQEELTRVQNTNDRLAERMQALEIIGMRGQRTAEAPSQPAEPEETRVARPTLKVVKLGPGAAAAPAEPEAEEAPAAEEKGPRPVLKEYGAKPGAAKPFGWRPAGRAIGAPMGQNKPGKPAAPQGT